MITRMETTTRTIDVSGLPEEAICAVESIISLLRPKGQVRPPFRSVEEWSQNLRAWAASHPRLDRIADDSRDSIYEGRGE
jgi:hypothetical protein